jgi:transcriptional antiterminator NusG
LAPNDQVNLEIDTTTERKWYVIHTYSGYENKVRTNLEKRIASYGMENQIFQVLIPEEEEIEFKGGKRVISKKHIFPGYVLVEMIMNDEAWWVVRHTPGVTGFVGEGTKPIPLRQQEIEKILKYMGLIETRPKINVQIGESVRVKSGPFENFDGIVKDIIPDRGKIRVNISMFGRETPVDLEFSKIIKEQ